MSDLFPQEPPSTSYSRAFEKCWSVHRVGSKKAAWNAGKAWSDANWLWLENYLVKRWKEDETWNAGKYVPHLSTIINQERWQDNYKKMRTRRDPGEGWTETHEEAMRKIQETQSRRLH